VTTNTEELGTLVLVATESGEPRGTTSHDCRNNRDSLYICDGSRATVESSISWEGRLQSGSTGLALEAFNQSRFFTANIGSSTTLNIDIKVVATSAGVLSNEALSVCLIDSLLELDHLVPELSTAVNISSLCSHTETNNECALNEFMRVMSQYLSIFTGARL
jgi:hypothetical protein